MHAPIKKTLLRANYVAYMTKALKKAIMSKQICQNKTNENLKSYKKQNNFCCKLYK